MKGYIGSAALLRTVLQVHKLLKQANPDLIYGAHKLIRMIPLISLLEVCDPVMGDNDKLYVPQESVEIYSNEIVPIADFITPNQFECEYVPLFLLCSIIVADRRCDFPSGY